MNETPVQVPLSICPVLSEMDKVDERTSMEPNNQGHTDLRTCGVTDNGGTNREASEGETLDSAQAFEIPKIPLDMSIIPGFVPDNAIWDENIQRWLDEIKEQIENWPRETTDFLVARKAACYIEDRAGVIHSEILRKWDVAPPRRTTRAVPKEVEMPTIDLGELGL